MKKQLLAIIFITTCIHLYGQLNCCENGNLIKNGQFALTSTPPTNTSNNIDLALYWSPIWIIGSQADLYDQNHAPGSFSPPNPADGNYASFWIDNRVWHTANGREGMSVKLGDNNTSITIYPNSGDYNLSFDIASLAGWGDSEVGVYGVYNPTNSITSPPVSSHNPTNLELYGLNNTVLLGTISVPNNTNGIKQQETLTFSTNSVNFPSNGIDHIFITRSSTVLNGSRYVAFDNFCIYEKTDTIIYNEIIMCSTFQEICGPIAPNGSTYTYQWYGPDHDPTSVILLGEDMCFTPSQTGNYTLIVTDENGCTANHTINVLDEIPQPNLGNDITIECGQNPVGNINILNQGFDGSNYTITWYHNGQEIQVGGETLMTSIASGEVTVVIAVEGCKSVSDTITITQEYCCPEDLQLVMDCETKELRVENLPNNITINTIFWDLNNQTIPNENNTTLQVTEEGIYSFGIIFTFPDGTECHHYIHFQYTEDYCCDITGSQAVVSILGVTNYYNVPNTPYGTMNIPAMCGRVALDGSLSTCEDGYFISVAPFDPASWSNTTPPIFEGWIQGQAPNNIDLTQPPFNLVFDNQTFYMIQFAVGPNWDDEYILFWYDCETKKEMTIAPNPNQGIFNVSMTNNKEEGTLEVIDLSGNIVYRGSIFKENSAEIDISRQKSGSYIVKVSIKGEVYSKKIIKE